MLGLVQVDPWLLDIGRPGTVDIEPGTVVSASTGSRVGLDAIVHAAKQKRFVLIGEEHDNAEAHVWQARIIEALHQAGRDVIVGYEMIQRPEQLALDLWSLGKLTEQDFLDRAKWQTSWGFDFNLYKPIFDVTKKYRLRNVALNVPRDWVRTVGRGGFDALSPEIRAQVPDLDLSNEQHKNVFVALMGGHPPTSPHIYSAQVLWDEAMADSAIKYLDKSYVTSRTVFVVIAGNGHVMYGQGIGWRIAKRTKDDPLTIVTVSGTERRKVSAGAGDFIIGVKPASD